MRSPNVKNDVGDTGANSGKVNHFGNSDGGGNSVGQAGAGYLKYHKNRFLPNECPHCHLPLAYVVGHRDGLLEVLIHDYKYDSARALASSLADIMQCILPCNLPDNTVIVPLPTTTKHIRVRGMDHTYLIAKYLGKMKHFAVQSVLVRAKNTVQVGATRKERIKQAPLAYTIDTGIELDFEATYLLLDDVWTTGASMKSAIELLRGAGVPVDHIRIALLAVSD